MAYLQQQAEYSMTDLFRSYVNCRVRYYLLLHLNLDEYKMILLLNLNYAELSHWEKVTYMHQ